MTLDIRPTHGLLHEPDVGSTQWWQRIQALGTPLHSMQHGQLRCTFLWRKSVSSPTALIDIYSQTAPIYQQWHSFSNLPNTDVLFFEIDLPLGWSGSYVLVTPLASAPESMNASVRRQWWTQQLQQHSQIDPYNPNAPYQAHIARWVNQLQCLGRPNLQPKKSSSTANQHAVNHHSLTWHSERMAQCYTIDVIQPQSTQKSKNQDVDDAELDLILFLDGQVWSRQLPLFSTQAELNSAPFKQSVFVFIHSESSAQRQHDYSCNDAFSHAFVHELLPTLQTELNHPYFRHIYLCGQSLGGLCALHTALLYPHVFSHIIAQSASLWWSDFSRSASISMENSRFLDHFLQQLSTLQSNHIELHAGSHETDMRQDACDLYTQSQHAETGFSPLHLHIFNGGHDVVHWRDDLSHTLHKLLN